MKNHIAEFRNAKDMTFQTLTERTGASNQQISYIEKDRRGLTVNWVEWISVTITLMTDTARHKLHEFSEQFLVNVHPLQTYRSGYSAPCQLLGIPLDSLAHNAPSPLLQNCTILNYASIPTVFVIVCYALSSKRFPLTCFRCRYHSSVL